MFGSATEPGKQIAQRLFLATGQHLHTAIGQIAHPAGQAEPPSLLACGRTKEHTLHQAAYRRVKAGTQLGAPVKATLLPDVSRSRV